MGSKNSSPAKAKPKAQKKISAASILQSPKARRPSHSFSESEITPLKMVLLGSENNGKSTFWKGVLAQFGNGLLWMNDVAANVRGNVVQGLKGLCEVSNAHADEPAFKFDDGIADSVKFISEYKTDEHNVLSPEFVKHVKIVWKDKGIQACLNARNQKGFRLPGADSLAHFVDDIARISAKDYVPTEQDAIWVHVPTRGEDVNHTEVLVKHHRLLVVDTDGRHGERHKWKENHKFDGVSALVFVVSLTSYDQVLVDDPTINAMQDSLDLFAEVCGDRTFADTPLVLLLSKADTFKRKVKEVPISTFFKDFESKSDDYDESVKHIRKTFEDLFHKTRRAVDRHGDVLYIQELCSVDPASVASSVEHITDVVAKNNPEHFQHKRRATNPLTHIFSNRDLGHDAPLGHDVD